MLKAIKKTAVGKIGFDTFCVLSDNAIEPSSLSSIGRILIAPRIYDKQIIVSPCHSEHWISTDLFKFRIYAERKNLHVIGACSFNQIPLYSLFCDEIILMNSKPVWYKRITGNRVHVEVGSHPDYVNIECCQFRNNFMAEVADKDVIVRFVYKKICLLKSAYKKFLDIKAELPFDVVIAEINCKSPPNFQADWLLGVDQEFQRGLVNKVGTDHYMTIQILASNYLNWHFLCQGGSSNLMCVLPLRAVSLLGDFSSSIKNVIQGFAEHKLIEPPFICSADKLKKEEVFSKLKLNWIEPRIFVQD